MIKQAAGDINTRAKAFVTRSYTDTFILFIILISLNLLSLALKLEKTYFNFTSRQQLLKHTGERQKTDGLNSINYKLKSIDFLPLYTRVNVVINQAAVMNSEPKTSLPSYLNLTGKT